MQLRRFAAEGAETSIELFLSATKVRMNKTLGRPQLLHF